MEKDFIISNEKGIHARPATLLVSTASRFKCDILMTYDGTTVDLKSIMNVVSLGLQRGSLITVKATGIDEVEAIDAIGKKIIEFNLR